MLTALIASDHAPSFVLMGHGDESRLLIGGSAVVIVDSETGLSVFREATSDSGLIVIRASDDWPPCSCRMPPCSKREHARSRLRSYRRAFRAE